MEGAAKKRKTAAETYSSMEKRLRELEDRIEKLEKKKPTAAAATARKSTVASLDEKMNTILDILTKVVVPTAAAAAGDSTQTQNYGKDTFLF